MRITWPARERRPGDVRCMGTASTYRTSPPGKQPSPLRERPSWRESRGADPPAAPDDDSQGCVGTVLEAFQLDPGLTASDIGAPTCADVKRHILFGFERPPKLPPSSQACAPRRPHATAQHTMSWRRILLVSVLLGCISLILNFSFQQELEGHWQAYSGFRRTGSKLFNSGSLWAVLAFYCGSKANSAWTGALAGMISAECALATHYLLGIPTSIYDHTALLSNIRWLIAGAVLCCPLGSLGWLSTRQGALPLASRFIPAICAMSEPLITRRLSIPPPELPWPERYSDLSSGVLLFIGGLLWAGRMIYLRSGRPHRRRRHPTQ